MRFGETSDRVKKLQQKVIDLGYPLPRYGADGDLGGESVAAIVDCITDLWPHIAVEEYLGNLDSPGLAIPENVVRAIMDAPVPDRPSWLYDVTKDHPVKNAYSYRRKLSKIDSICLHQTACNLSERLKRWHFIRCHFGITRKGKAILVNTFDVIVHASNWFNHRSVAFEISGNFAGDESNPRTLWKKGGRRASMSDEQIEAARNAMRLSCEMVANAGGEIKYVFGHRQCNRNKPACPGELIWKNCAIWAMDELGLKNDPDYTKGSGLPIPKVWDDRSEHRYYR